MNGQERLAEQSREWLLQALFELLGQLDYSRITVKDISETAKLSRRTFYRSFKNKGDLINYYGDQVIKRYIESLKQIETTEMSFEQVLAAFFNFWWQERQKIKLLIRQDLFINFLVKMTPNAVDLYDLFKAPWHIKGSKQEISYIMSFSVGGFWNILNTWLGKENPEKPQRMVNILLKGLKKINS
ncbi:TetR/AcrR family transcriptional regulator [Oenococcus sp. UCMA 16435]|nr:TetR/AcrR family transcriptional regulator [Oenococcus sp. UCMA 16435]MDI4584284.1 TetR family transcriptional regulator [Oenococcus sp. UCMA 14587]